MKLILILPSLISFFTFATSAIIQNENSDCILNKKIESCEKICQDLVIEIGSYYKCPQQILGFLSKSFYKSFFQVYSFNRLISGRFNIPELYNAESSNDLYIFKNLAHVKDENTLLYILLRAHFGKNAFDANAKLILRYIIKHSLTKRIN